MQDMLIFIIMRCLKIISAVILLVSAGTVFIHADVPVTILRHKNDSVVLAELPANSDPGGYYLELTVSGKGRISFGDGDSDLNFSTGGKPEKLYIHAGFTGGLLPEKISLTGEDGSAYDLISAAVNSTAGNTGPLPADIGHIIFSDFSGARDPRWELYSWNLDPEVLIFDTADYEVQSRIFKRLAFFVEKPGFVGTLVTNERLKGLHGWNAHDYRPKDLALFFSRAEEENFGLNPEEISLRSILLDNGVIIRKAGGGFSGGGGAVLSVSRESPPDWRYRFLTHECLHGLFFTSGSFRAACADVFNSLDPEEIEFWKRLLDYRGYDVENSYLLINEFMAYSLQQPLEEIDDYFKTFLYLRMGAARPYEKTFISEFELSHPDSFTDSATALEDVLYRYTGRPAGHLANLEPSDLDPGFYDLFPLR